MSGYVRTMMSTTAGITNRLKRFHGSGTYVSAYGIANSTATSSASGQPMKIRPITTNARMATPIWKR